jgi:hypothetical protein
VSDLAVVSPSENDNSDGKTLTRPGWLATTDSTTREFGSVSGAIDTLTDGLADDRAAWLADVRNPGPRAVTRTVCVALMRP